MGKLMDMLPIVLEDIRAREHSEAMMRFTGCDVLGCLVTTVWQPWDFSYVVFHNGEQRVFDVMATRHRDDGMVIYHRSGSLEPLALMPRAVADWIAEQHVEIRARRETERQAAIAADGWLEHAVMIGLADG